MEEKKNERKDLLAKEIKKCPECGSTHLIWDYKRGELVCQDCGLVVDESFIDQGPEWRAFNPEQKEKRERTGPPHGAEGIPPTVIKGQKDAFGKTISSRTKTQVYRIERWQKRIHQGVKTPFPPSADIIIGTLGLDRKVRELSVQFYKEVLNKRILRGRDVKSIVAATVFLAARFMGEPITLDDVERTSGIPKKQIGRVFRKLKGELDLRIPSLSPGDYIPRFCKESGLSEKAREKAFDILSELNTKNYMSGKSPEGIAVSILYIVSIITDENRTQEELAKMAGVTEVTLRNRYKEIKEILNITFSPQST